MYTGNSVLRRPSFEDKYHITSSPAGSDMAAGSSRSDSPLWDNTTNSQLTADADQRLSVVSTAGRPFVAVTSRTRSPAVVNSRPVLGPPRQFIVSPPPPSSSSSSRAVSSHTVIIPSTKSVSYVTVSRPVTSRGHDTAVTACSSRPSAVVLQQVHSSEVTWPTAQRATTPPCLSHDDDSSLSSTVHDKPLTLSSDKPPPPYPARSPAPPSTDVDIQCTEIEAPAGPAAGDSTDEDVAMTTECQRIESPKPVRLAGDDSRCETKVLPGYFDSHPGQVVHTYVPLSRSSVTWYWSKHSDVLWLGG